MSEPTAQTHELLEYERGAYQAYLAGELDQAIAVWNDILNDEEKRSFFAQEDGLVEEMASDLAIAYSQKGDEASMAAARTVIEKWQLDIAEGADAAQ